MAKKLQKTDKFKWNVWIWNINHDRIEEYDVVPVFRSELKRLARNEKPKTKKEFEEFLEREARFHFWSKCEYEMIVHAWPAFKNDMKVDVYDQLRLNWNAFVDRFWNNLRTC